MWQNRTDSRSSVMKWLAKSSLRKEVNTVEEVFIDRLTGNGSRQLIEDRLLAEDIQLYLPEVQPRRQDEYLQNMGDYKSICKIL